MKELSFQIKIKRFQAEQEASLLQNSEYVDLYFFKSLNTL